MNKKLAINSRVKLIDKVAQETFKINPHTIGKVTRIYYSRVTVEFIQNDQRTALNLFDKQLKMVK